MRRIFIRWVLLPILMSSKLASAEIELSEKIKRNWEEVAENSNYPFDLRMWSRQVLQGKYLDAFQNWSTVQTSIPISRQETADVTFLFLLWRYQLYQGFFDALISRADSKRFLVSEEWSWLSQSIGSDFEKTLNHHAIVLRPDQIEQLQKISWGQGFDSLKAWGALRNQREAVDVITHFKTEENWYRYLVLSAVSREVKNKNFKSALELLLSQVNKKNDNQDFYALQIARLYFQMTDLIQAEQWYLKVSAGSKEELAAKEELLWVWLRSGESVRLRGSLVSFANESNREQFHPEVFAVRAISNLKFCRFSDVKKDFEHFRFYNEKWAETIDKALSEKNTPQPPQSDWFSELIERSISARKSESNLLKEYFNKSLVASLPSVGKQKHFKDLEDDLSANLLRLQMLRESEYRRQWENYGVSLREAIRKMKFVKVELLSQLGQGLSSNSGSKISAENKSVAGEKMDQAASGKMSFPFDSVDWADEAFAARSGAHGVCL